jgi:hypothetical protein
MLCCAVKFDHDTGGIKIKKFWGGGGEATMRKLVLVPSQRLIKYNCLCLIRTD